MWIVNLLFNFLWNIVPYNKAFQLVHINVFVLKNSLSFYKPQRKKCGVDLSDRLVKNAATLKLGLNLKKNNNKIKKSSHNSWPPFSHDSSKDFFYCRETSYLQSVRNRRQIFSIFLRIYK